MLVVKVCSGVDSQIKPDYDELGTSAEMTNYGNVPQSILRQAQDEDVKAENIQKPAKNTDFSYCRDNAWAVKK